MRSRVMFVVTLTLIPTLGFMLLATLEDRRREESVVEAQALRLAESISVGEQHWIEGTRQLLVGLSHAPLQEEAAACSAFLSELLGEYDNYINLGIIDPTGTVRCSAFPVPAAIDVADRAYFQRAIESQTFAVGECHVSPVTGRPAVSFGQPLIDDQGITQGVLFATLDLTWLNRRGAEAVVRQLPQGASLTEVDESGTVLVQQPNPDAWVGKSAGSSPLVRAVLEREQGVMEATGLDGQAGICAYAPVPSRVHANRIYVIVGVPDRVAFADARRVFRRNLMGLGLVTTLGLVGGWLLSGAFVVRRVRALVDAARDLSRGNLTARTGLPHDRSELGHLARAFDRMAGAIEQREAERQQTEDDLRRQADRLEILHAIDGADLATHSLEKIAQEAMRHVRQTIPCLRATVLLLDWEAGEMIQLATRGVREALFKKGERIPLAPFLDSEGRLADLMANDDRRPIQPDRSPTERRLLKEGIHAYHVVPLTVSGEQIGALVLGLGSDQILSPADLELAREIADALAVPIQNARLLEEVRASREHLRTLSQRLMEAQEAERRHVARELHDQIGQTLTVIKINLQAMQRLSSPAPFGPYLTESVETVDRALQKIHELSLDLRPTLLDDLGLAAAVESYVERLSERAKFREHCLVEPPEISAPPDLEIACFRLAQEALTNVVRHAHAENVWIDLRERDSELRLTVSDDGVGFDLRSVLQEGEEDGQLGLMGMQERVALLGGEMEIDSGPGRGTEIRVRLPLASSSQTDLGPT
jgi:signal transduction histidine kinase/HAMP domain-containing protein